MKVSKVTKLGFTSHHYSVVALLSVCAICTKCGLESGGSYPYAERYILQAPEADVIQAVQEYKAQHPEVVPPLGLTDGREDKTDHWYHLYFYLPKKNQKVFVHILPVS